MRRDEFLKTLEDVLWNNDLPTDDNNNDGDDGGADITRIYVVCLAICCQSVSKSNGSTSFLGCINWT